MAEILHRMYGDMMLTILMAVGLPNTYWSSDIKYAVYLNNHLPHKSISTTPMDEYTGNILNLAYLKVFGNYVTSKNPGKHPTKLAKHVSHSICLGFTATNRNVIFQESISNQIKRARYVLCEKPYYNRPNRPPYLEQLHNLPTASTTPPTTDKQEFPPTNISLSLDHDASNTGPTPVTTTDEQTCSLTNTPPSLDHDESNNGPIPVTTIPDNNEVEILPTNFIPPTTNNGIDTYPLNL